MANRDPADCSRRLLCPPVSYNNRGDTNRCTTPKRCRQCHKGRTRSAETISQARCRHTHLQPRLSPEIFPAKCSPSTSHRDEIHHPTHKFFLITRRGPQTRTPLQSVNVCPPISHTLLRRGKRSEQRDISPCL